MRQEPAAKRASFDDIALSRLEVQCRGNEIERAVVGDRNQERVLDAVGMVLDDECTPVGPGDVVYIPPGTRHALRGTVEIINVVSPPFDASDEYVVEEERQPH